MNTHAQAKGNKHYSAIRKIWNKSELTYISKYPNIYTTHTLVAGSLYELYAQFKFISNLYLNDIYNYMLVMFSNTALLILNFNKLYAPVSALFDVDDNNGGVAVDKFIYLNHNSTCTWEYMNISERIM